MWLHPAPAPQLQWGALILDTAANRRRLQKLHRYAPRISAVDLVDAESIDWYRLDRAGVQEVVELLARELQLGTQSARSTPPPVHCVLVALSYLATGNLQ